MDSDRTLPEPPPGEFEPAPPVAAPRRGGTRILALAVAGVAVAAIGGVAWVLLALRGTSDVVKEMVPPDASVYATVYLDPAAGQKLNVRSLLQKFPDLRDTEELNRRLDELLNEALADSGLTSRDVRPWLGSQVAVAAWIRGIDEPDVAFFITSKDDEAAQAALDRARSRAAAEGVRWTDREHLGVTISSGSGGSGFWADESAYAVIDSTVLFGSRADVLERVIDTARGDGETLGSSQKFTETLDPLAEESLGLVYVDIGQIVDDVLPQSGIDASDLPLGFGSFDAFRSFGMVVRAESDGVLADVALTFDSSKLSEEERRAIAAQPHQNEVLLFTPEDAYGVFAGSNVQASGEVLLEAGREDPNVDALLTELGVPEAIDALSGDIGIEVSPGTVGAFPAGALLMGTDDEAVMQGFLDGLSQYTLQFLGSEFSAGGDQVPFAPDEDEYQGVRITSFPIPDLSLVGVAPAYAVTDGMAIVASSPEEIKDLIDARASERNITASDRFRQALGHADAENTAIYYVDIEAVTDAVRVALPPEEQASFDADIGPNLEPLKAFIFTTSGAAERSTGRFFLLIE
jgi:hypothetical protein